MAYKRRISELLGANWNVNSKVGRTRLLQKHSFDEECTIRLLPTDNEHAKDGFCGKKWWCHILFWITIWPFSAVVDILTYDSFRYGATHLSLRSILLVVANELSDAVVQVPLPLWSHAGGGTATGAVGGNALASLVSNVKVVSVESSDSLTNTFPGAVASNRKCWYPLIPGSGLK